MKTRNITTAALLLALGSMAACAADAPGGIDPNNPDNPPGPDDVTNLSLGGKFEINSKFDIATNMPGTVGDVFREIVDATNGTSDPAEYLIMKALEQMPAGSLKNSLQGAVPFVSGYLNDRLVAFAPDFVTKMKLIGATLDDATKNFGLLSELNVTGAPGALTSVHTLTGVEFKIQNNQIPFMFADYNSPNVVTNGVGIKLDTSGKVTINDHTMPLSYGKVVRIALDEAVIPLVDSQARNLNELFVNLVDCQQVGIQIAAALEINSPSAFESACNAGLTLAAGAIYNKINAIDASALEFKINGTAKCSDTNRDNKCDKIDRGSWGGKLRYAGVDANLATATFSGKSR